MSDFTERLHNEWCGNCPKKKRNNIPKIFVGNDIYDKLVNGEPVHILVESIGKQMIEVTLMHTNKEKENG